ncbi:MAG: rod shape-determining protein RodA [Parcubacteria group bacterium]|nr:rod shape-determining protein RodA [Parcubacteria group bacterium]
MTRYSFNNQATIPGRVIQSVDWVLFGAVFLLVCAGLVTMYSFGGESPFFNRQLVWIGAGIIVFFGLSIADMRFLKRTDVVVVLYGVGVCILLLLAVFGTATKGAQSWLSVGGFGIQPADPIKIALILLLSKYFSRRHIEIAHIRHIIVSGVYAAVPFVLIFLQPDFGSALIIGAIWLGMVGVSGISKKHLFAVFAVSALSLTILWNGAFTLEQKERISTFLHPLADIQGAGYHAYQSTIAVGSGQLLGKGVGYGTQSRLEFLPEYETDFIFAAFAEEWGLAGSFLILILFGIVIWRLIRMSFTMTGNVEKLFTLGTAVYLGSHMVIHVGMNIGLLPVTGLPLPFVSYGGSHILTECIALGIVMAYHARTFRYRSDGGVKEIVGVDATGLS